MTVPRLRILAANQAPPRPAGDYVLYWMIANRRTRWNFALQRAVELAAEMQRPLLVLEALRCDYPHASDRLHRFIVQGMADNAAQFAAARVDYFPFVERERGAGKGLLEALAQHACVVVTDLYPGFFLPRMVGVAAKRVQVRVEQVDSCGILPLAEAGGSFPLAHSFRRHLHRNVAPHLRAFPLADPLATDTLPRGGGVPQRLRERYPAASRAMLLSGAADQLATLPIDHGVPPVAVQGGAAAACRALDLFMRRGIDRYGEDRNHPDLEGSSGLSPWLHFGHISAHEAVRAVLDREGWTEARMSPQAAGSREGWWGLSASAEAFLDQIVTWRELGFHAAYYDPSSASYESLPPWARATLEKHASDRRSYLYPIAQLESASTHDRLWNAAQRQLVGEGRMHNYLRMLWGKKILEWTKTPREALEVMTALNDRYALDGRDPSSASGIAWVLGRYDRPWGPERDVFGTVRYMSSSNTLKKVRVKQYLERWAG